ncbi:helix-turn-helix transcriptional regulator [Trichlorobacter ammonificans]|uniref:WYL domain-containing protein n=1 Tax=Trichlorobacter ammonificans TaxID=2916410 RepID=A0ABN8HMI5_9BACT|nr:WYL domain-containing protein [Trichlorobacter ammonificans]CAH2032186.1 WYL domain-containing protein [Trichlorobacter ammonificans]
MGDQLFLERFIWFDQKVRSSRWPNAGSLAARFETSVKTAQRSISYFRDRLHAPLEYDQSRKGYYYTDPAFQLPVARLSQAELLALLISRKLITEASAGTLGDELGNISSRLGMLLAARLPGRANPEEAFSFRWKGINPTDPVVFQNVTTALLQGTLLSFCYYSPTSSACTMRTVEPHHMVNYLGTWHLIAFCRLRNDWRDFVLGRITLCTVGHDSFDLRPHDQWQPFLANTFGIFQNRKSFNVKLKFSPERSRWVRSELWHEGQTEELLEDGSLILTIPASHEVEIMMEILKHGSHVEVLEPEWLRGKVADEIAAANCRYKH